MEGFTYVDLYATKGFEYLLAIVFLLTLIPFWRLLSRPAAAVSRAVRRMVPAISEWFRLPEGIYYHQGHSWAMPEGGHIVKVGLDDFAQKLVGKIDGIAVPKVGTTVNQGEKAWDLRVASTSIEMLSPVDGEVVAVNDRLIDSPDILNTDPYGDAWLMKVRVPKVSGNLKNLLRGTLAQKWMEGVRETLVGRMNYDLGLVYQDGGLPVDGMAKNIDRDHWDELVKEFFLVSEQ